MTGIDIAGNPAKLIGTIMMSFRNAAVLSSATSAAGFKSGGIDICVGINIKSTPFVFAFVFALTFGFPLSLSSLSTSTSTSASSTPLKAKLNCLSIVARAFVAAS
eukprot:936013_1